MPAKKLFDNIISGSGHHLLFKDLSLIKAESWNGTEYQRLI
jgi:hypothetical protein